MRYVFKPLTLVLLTATALALDPDDPTVRTWFVVALVMSLAGDVFLMLPGDLFVPGLGSFLLAHVAYVVGMVAGRASNPPASSSASRWSRSPSALVGAADRRGRAPQRARARPAVLAYMGVISAMLVCAIGTGAPLAIAGGAARSTPRTP